MTRIQQHQYQQQQSEEGMPVRLSSGDQDMLPFKSLGVDYTKVVFDRSRSSSVSSAHRVPTTPPVNYLVVEKVAPPQITRNVRHMFETGDLPDRHEVKKLDINIHEGQRGAGVFENEPVMNENVVRETDEQTDEFHEGYTQELRTKWLNKENEAPVPINRAPVKLAEDDGCVLESEPITRDDVVRESDSTFYNPDEIAKGKSSQLREKFSNINDDYPKERAPIKLYDETDATPVVYENEPTAPTADVTGNENEDEAEKLRIQRGKAANLKNFFSTQPEYRKEDRPLDIATDGGVVLESQPTVREDVVRESDLSEVDKVVSFEAGRSRNMAGMWENRKQEYRPKVFKMDVEASAAPVVLESEPVVLEGVVRESMPVDELVTPGDGHARKLASKFIDRDETDGRRGPKECIVIEKGESHICESVPQVRTDVVKCDDASYTNDIEAVQQGFARGLKEQWLNTNDEVLLARKMAEPDRRPRWKVELEEAQRAKEAQAALEDEDEPQPEEMVDDTTLIDQGKTTSMKERWARMREEEEERLRRERCPEPVRFTPPREITPPPLKESQQSSKKVTLNPGAARTPLNPGSGQQAPPARPVPQQNGYPSHPPPPQPQQQQGGGYRQPPPGKTMTSKTVISLKSS